MIKKIEEQFLQYVKKMMSYNEAIQLMYWDLRTGAPKKGVEQRSEVIGILSQEVFKMSTSEEMAAFIAELSPKNAYEQLSEITRYTLEECKKEYERNKKIPADEYKEYVVLQSKAESVWEEAKATADFALFRPYLEKLVEFNKRFIEYWGYEGNPYNTLLDLYEPGITVDVLDEVFQKLREHIVPLVQEVVASPNKPETSFLFHPFPKEKQRAFSLELLRELGYDFAKGRLDETVHPFAIGLNPNDVRITTRYDERDFRTAIFGTIHECGHALYEQHISEALIGTPLCTGTSMGIHESQSLFYENFIARHYAYWKRNYPRLQRYAPDQFSGVPLDAFYRAINEAKPSLIRIEADELTYPLHIIIRYEIEKGLFNGTVEVKDLPEIWNGKYEEYLGIRPDNDAVGVLQDVHWSGGSFGYFPSYALGYMYAAQFKHAMLKDLPHFDELLEKGELSPIREWLTERVHRFGKTKKPLEILRDATGEGLNADYLIRYLEEKYKAIYQV
ncbi:carboxypeptidase M32 [Parageobacillus thermoglucosidasius]|uniref:Metal-dependent carboxypeptidase n=2 Tax=Anoxybacillaceae TaxID=3120669 RepID=A0AAN0YPS6_PARTM|nr:carboxypeptidase M32 [Parageobacillus thermoglucosidasius]KYD16766.1 Thermostable carboxypeptidase 1 [Anoxybacillus flavithermus]REK58108.1 MAG: carboxypeptidase M32 [Geobacillus sp.]AEH47693.1 Carboxypeptidase Taq [Parageobacillus thermoglucosidasius C56-YS93]ALF11065.1 peptidase M32 [Parageobacillus thermoglucosidasius]ANZ31142.1 peptidase M32 [Parageobacillus thermoglucosidasius]